MKADKPLQIISNPLLNSNSNDSYAGHHFVGDVKVQRWTCTLSPSYHRHRWFERYSKSAIYASIPIVVVTSVFLLSSSSGQVPILALTPSVLQCLTVSRMLTKSVTVLKISMLKHPRFISKRGPTSASWTSPGVLTKTWCLHTFLNINPT